jgi:ubiquitin carboxyl-terminal hydrolase 4/11/15
VLVVDAAAARADAPAALTRPATLNGKVGLQNLGNTCFFNSGTQCLLHTRVLVRAMLDASSLQINAKNPLGMKGLLVSAFANLCKQVWFGTSGHVSPADLKRVIGRFAPQFSGWQQHDSHELLTFMLDGIHEDLNHPSGPVSVDGVFGDGTDDEAAADRSWERHVTRNRSIVVDHIHGQYRSKLTCPECKKISVVFDPFMAIPLPISKPHCARLRVVFVPYDFAQPVRTLVAYAPTRENPIPKDVVARLIREQIPGDADLLIGSPDYVEGVKWTVTTKAKAVYAFEVPDRALRYAPASVRYVSKTTAHPGFVKDLSKIFLVGLPEAGATREAITAAVEQRIASVWEIDDEPIADEVKKLIAWDTVSEKAVAFPEGQKLTAVVTRPAPTVTELASSTSLQKSTVEPRLFGGWVTVILNSKVPFSLARVSRSLDLFKAVNIEPAVDERLSLDDCFTFLSEPETLDEKNQWFCPNCRKHVCAEKIVDIWKVPDVLIIQLKRFVRSGYSVSKLGTFVNFPDRINMADFIAGPQRAAEQPFRLYAVSNHMGGLGGGHYTAHAMVQDPNEGPDENAQWYSFNDSSAGPARPGSWHSPEAYVLFYERLAQPRSREDSEDPLLQPDE